MSNTSKPPVATITDANDKELMTGGKIFGAMPMVAKLTPDQARAALRLLDWKTLLFLLTMLFRRE
jgi:hypothetical protein